LLGEIADGVAQFQTLANKNHSMEIFDGYDRDLLTIDPLLTDFARLRGYVIKQRGRYPNRYLYKEGQINRFIDLSMDLDSTGKYHTMYTSDITYSLGAGAWIDRSFTRFLAPRVILEHISFKSVKDRISIHLPIFADFVESLTDDYILQTGQIGVIRG